MAFKLLYPEAAIALPALTAGTNPIVETDTAPEADLPAETEVATSDTETPAAGIAAGVGLTPRDGTIQPTRRLLYGWGWQTGESLRKLGALMTSLRRSGRWQ